ncbi:DMT family transporter [Clostridium sp.]|uniref:DMT family transporter n=1 Tax=Clostridium sp. TaxID=1506 RepID=UPI003217FCF4
MEIKQYKATSFAILAAALYAISSPVSKLLLNEIPPTLMASFLYLGAGLGMSIVGFIKHKKYKEKTEAKLSKEELPFTIGMVVLDIAAPIFLMIGLNMTTSANASLLNNFEIVATSLIALLIFKESISKRLWGAISLITLSSIILSVEDISSFSFSFGSIFVLLACICWGLENNCTRKLSAKDPLEVVVIKGFGSGIGALIIALIIGERITNIPYMIAALLLGFVAYGLSIFFYIYAQRDLGAAKTSTYYAIAPFIGVGLSLIIFREIPILSFVIALVIMIIGTYFASTEKHNHQHRHMVVTHEHSHSHDDGHHNHIHDKAIIGTHNHIHNHKECIHSHKHTQDIHHSHSH